MRCSSLAANGQRRRPAPTRTDDDDLQGARSQGEYLSERNTRLAGSDDGLEPLLTSTAVWTALISNLPAPPLAIANPVKVKSRVGKQKLSGELTSECL